MHALFPFNERQVRGRKRTPQRAWWRQHLQSGAPGTHEQRAGCCAALVRLHYIPLQQPLALDSLPLHPQWLAWLGDEMDAARTPADLERIRGLYKTAAADYLSIELWAGHLE